MVKGNIRHLRYGNVAAVITRFQKKHSKRTQGETFITDKSVAPKTKARPKADLADPTQVAAPIPGLIATLSVSLGSKVKKGDKLLMMEAMKMQNTVYAPCDGVVAELHVALSDTVESKDLLIKIRTS